MSWKCRVVEIPKGKWFCAECDGAFHEDTCGVLPKVTPMHAHARTHKHPRSVVVLFIVFHMQVHPAFEGYIERGLGAGIVKIIGDGRCLVRSVAKCAGTTVKQVSSNSLV